MKRLWAPLAVALLLVGSSQGAFAQETVKAVTVSACGTPNNTPVVGNPYPVTMDTVGRLCSGVTALPSTSGGVTVYSAPGGTGNALLTSTPVLISAGAHSLYGVELANTNSADIWLQVFDVASAGAVTLGTTVPYMSIRVPGNGSGATANAAFWDHAYVGDGRIAFANGVVVAVTTTPTGSTAPGAAIQATLVIK